VNITNRTAQKPSSGLSKDSLGAVAKEAKQGLSASRGFWKTKGRKISNAEESLDRVESLAQENSHQDVLNFLKLGRVASSHWGGSDTSSMDVRTRRTEKLNALRSTLDEVSAGVAGGVAPLAGLALRLCSHAEGPTDKVVEALTDFGGFEAWNSLMGSDHQHAKHFIKAAAEHGEPSAQELAQLQSDQPKEGKPNLLPPHLSIKMRHSEGARKIANSFRHLKDGKPHFDRMAQAFKDKVADPSSGVGSLGDAIYKATVETVAAGEKATLENTPKWAARAVAKAGETGHKLASWALDQHAGQWQDMRRLTGGRVDKGILFEVADERPVTPRNVARAIAAKAEEHPNLLTALDSVVEGDASWSKAAKLLKTLPSDHEVAMKLLVEGDGPEGLREAVQALSSDHHPDTLIRVMKHFSSDNALDFLSDCKDSVPSFGYDRENPPLLDDQSTLNISLARGLKEMSSVSQDDEVTQIAKLTQAMLSQGTRSYEDRHRLGQFALQRMEEIAPAETRPMVEKVRSLVQEVNDEQRYSEWNPTLNGLRWLEEHSSMDGTDTDSIKAFLRSPYQGRYRSDYTLDHKLGVALHSKISLQSLK